MVYCSTTSMSGAERSWKTTSGQRIKKDMKA